MSFQIDVSDLEKLEQIFTKIESNLPKQTSTFLKTKGDTIIKEYHDTVPVRTGTLQRSIHGALEGNYRYKGGATVPYAPPVEKRRGNLQKAWENGTSTIEQDLQQMIQSSLFFSSK